MADTQIILIAKLKAKAGQTEALKTELTSLIEPTRNETGCVRYDLHVSSEDDSQFMFYEIWKSQADLDKHIETPHLKGLLAKMDELVEGKLDVSTWETI